MAELTSDIDEGWSRRRFIALTGGSVVAAVGLTACGGESDAIETARFGDGDTGVLNYLLRLEHLQADFYAAVVQNNLFDGSELRTMKRFGKEEGLHVAALTKAVERAGGEPGEKPKTEFPLESPDAALNLAARMENSVASAYLGQARNVDGRSALETMLSIHSVEGRHAATIDTLLGRPIAPDGAFATPATATAVLESAEPFVI
jgi:hypothetical protein